MTDARAAALAGALIGARAESCPRHQVRCAWKAHHIVADLRDDDVGRNVTDARHRRQQLDVLAKRVEMSLHTLIKLADGFVKRIDLAQVHLDEETVLLAHAATQRLDEHLTWRFQPSAGELDELLRVGFTCHQRIEHRTTALAQNVADYTGELDVGVLQCLLDALRVACGFAYQLFARAHQRPQILDWRRRYEAAADEAVRE